ncbi:MAG TPA: ankyrin repeat domain-containing protein [Candidatus Eisenbacteria bacterium]|jgi:ankyrin repeat protein
MSGPDREPAAPSFERIRRLAKQLTRACRQGDAEALARVRAQLPRLAALDATAAGRSVRLADVQHALAREAQVENWAALKALVQSQEPLIAQVERFTRAFHDGDGATLRRVIEQFPQVARTSIHAACAACDAAAVEAWLARDPACAHAKFTRSEWTPLVCVAASPLFAMDEARAAASVAIGGRLLALGADANTSTPVPGATNGSRLSVLYRASELGNAALVRLLLEHGADPNDGESTYHAAERNHRDVLELLIAHGAEISATHQPWNNTVLYFLAGYRDDQERAKDATAGMEWLLEHGADPNVPSYDHRETPLHRIADLGRGPAVAELLLRHGADPRRPRADGRTPYELAMRAGNGAVAALLRARGGAVETLRPEDAFLHACATGDEAAARAALAAHPALRGELLEREPAAVLHAAESGNASAVRVVAALGFDLGREGPWGGTVLHWAAWRGRVELVRALIAAGAPINVRDQTYGSSPIAWAAHGSNNCRTDDDAYLAVIDLLLAAGAGREPSFNKWNEPPENLSSETVADHLRARGFAEEDA